MSLSARRAWIEIKKKGRARRPGQTSLSARRAWIEILGSRIYDMSAAVALRKESVDRNSWAARARVAQYWSLSARRAWIEITRYISSQRSRNVALRKESVDRNRLFLTVLRVLIRRSPQGERG